MTIIDVPADLATGWWQYRTRLRRDLCAYCPRLGNTIDHIQPRSTGGIDDPTNLAGCCKDCNGGKGATSLLMFLLERQGELNG